MSSFEDHLWSDLVREHGDRMRTAPSQTGALAASVTGADAGRVRRLRRPALLTGSALGTAGAAVAAVLTLTATTTAPAFAVTDNTDGSITVTLREISALSGLNAEFARRGLNARAVPMSSACPTKGFGNALPLATNFNRFTITLDPSEVPDGYTAVVAATQTASGQVELVQGAVPPPVPTCFNTEIPTRIPLKGPIPPAIRNQIRKIQREMVAKRRAEAKP
jgi:hypothetical protein